LIFSGAAVSAAREALCSGFAAARANGG